MSEFRDPSLTPTTLATFFVGGALAFGVANICTVDFQRLSNEEYFQWVTIWKQAYADLSSRSRELRRTQDASNMASTQSARHTLRVLSNTLLNVREVARAVRRARLDAEWAAQSPAPGGVTVH